MCRIARAISRQTTQKERHDAAENNFWRRQLRAAWWLNGITLLAALIAIGTVGVLISTLKDARQATVWANQAWIAPRTAYLQRLLTLSDLPSFKVSYDNIGKQPALDTQMWARVELAGADLLIGSFSKPELAESVIGQNPTCDRALQRGQVIWPSSSKVEAYSDLSIDDPTQQPPITQAVLDGKDALVIQGCFIYKTFDEVHKSSFCYWFRQVPPAIIATTTSAFICPIGNDIVR
jgi:hypothetical protein